MLEALEAQLAGMTGEGEEFEQATKSYRQSIFKLKHKMNKLASMPEVHAFMELQGSRVWSATLSDDYGGGARERRGAGVP